MYGNQAETVSSSLRKYAPLYELKQLRKIINALKPLIRQEHATLA